MPIAIYFFPSEVPQCLIPNPFAMTEDVGSNEQPQSDDCTCWNITHILSIKAGTDIPIMNPDLVGENLNPIVLKVLAVITLPRLCFCLLLGKKL